MKAIVFFNNKGGVGKTTLACNVASFLALHKRKRVLLIDADPQCNATQAMLDEDVCERIYLSKTSNQKTLEDVLKPFEDGYPEIASNISPGLASGNKYNVDLLPGHPKLSTMEDKFSEHWSKLISGEIEGFRITNWVEQLLLGYADKYDVVFFDVGPSLGALNRTVILASDFLVSPFGCDIFSILGISNISSWIKDWSEDYRLALELATRKGRRESLEKYHVITSIDKQFRLAGYSVQQYVSRKFKEGPRPVKAYDRIMRDIPEAVRNNLDFITPSRLSDDKLRLADIPYVYSLVPLSQSSKVPIHALTSVEGLTGSQYGQVKDYTTLMGEFAGRLLSNVGIR